MPAPSLDSSAFDQTYIEQARENETYIFLITGVTAGGTPAISGSVIRLPDEGESGYNKEPLDWEVLNVSLKVSASRSRLKSVTYESTLNQRNATTMSFDETYAGKDAVLIVKSANFSQRATKVQQWFAMYGNAVIVNGKVDLKEGRVPFKFVSKDNAVAIDVLTLGFPTSLTNQPTSLTINQNAQWAIAEKTYT